MAYVKLEDVLGVLNKRIMTKNIAINEIKNLPTADVEEVKHGEWIRGGIWGDTGSVAYKCSACGETTYDSDLFRYCPECGAKMDGGKAE